MRGVRLPKVIVLLVLLGGAATGVGLVAARLSAPPPIVQPIAFNHAIHVKQEELECAECHRGARTEAWAGFPDLKDCYDCHQEAEGDHPDEPKVREYAKRGAQIPWVPVNRNEGHVFFSHRAHVAVAKMKCQECHGKIEDLTEPVSRPMPDLHSMDVCVDCHEERQASIECAACHK